jgi:uncharacterized protein YerC
MKEIDLSSIRIDGDTQARLSVNQQIVEQYAEHMRDGDQFPPVIVFHDGEDYWLADGFHRYFATKGNGHESIEADIKEGTLEDAQLFAYGANSRRGLSMTSEDNRNIITKMLNHSVWSKWTNAEIARHVGVSKMTVGRVKQSLAPSEETKKTYTNKHGQEATIETKNLGRKKTEPKEPEQEAEPEVDPAVEQMDELTDTILSMANEIQVLKDRIALGQWDASDIEKIDIEEVVKDLREQIRVLEIDNKALRESRDMFQTRNAEMIRTINSLKAKLKKYEQK